MSKSISFFISVMLILSVFSSLVLAVDGSVDTDTSLDIDDDNDSDDDLETDASVSAGASVDDDDEDGSDDQDGSDNRESILARIGIKTGLNISGDANASLGAMLRVYLSNGKYADIRVMPETASATAQAKLNATCDEDDCSVELKEVGSGQNIKAAYEVQVKQQAKLLGFINTNMNVKADVDAETGEVISVNKPWWAFLAVEQNTEAELD